MDQWDWLALSLVSGVGSQTARALLDYYGSVESILSADADDLVRQRGLSPILAERIAQAKSAQSYQMEKRLLEESPETRLLCLESPDYPTRLQHISSPPMVLYWQGSLPHAEFPCLAFVGSRSCTHYGRRHTRRLIQELAEQVPEMVIISGLARGIDTVAHEAALEFGLKTIAVLAGGLHHVYPPENETLAREITKQGALISEFPLALKPVGRNFPIRNRVVSGLSQGVVVTECRPKSGAKITAAFGLDQNREIFALPGSVDSELSAGPHELISRSHAKLVVSAQEILEELHIPSASAAQQEFPFHLPEKQILDVRQFSEGHLKTLKAIQGGMETIDQVHHFTNIPIDQLLGMLVELELMGLLQTTGGQLYRLHEGIYLPED